MNNKRQFYRLFVIFIFCFATEIFPQVIKKPNHEVLLKQSQLISVTQNNNKKILSGKLITNISKKKLIARGTTPNGTNEPKENVIIYMEEYPTDEQITELRNQNINCFLDLWTPPMENHPYGFFIAEMPISKLNTVLSFAFVKKMDTAEYQSFPKNNNATIAINADDVWNEGYTGTGVKVAILDSGLDDAYDGTDLPATYTAKDYSNYPTIDDDVANSVTGHGTHVTGSVLGRGVLSNGRTDDGNGTQPFKGSAPNADLIFLKIGNNMNASASGTAMIAAMDAAVNTYEADILSMSYGGWYTYHDGSSAVEQKIDWIYSQGVPFFIAAGNDANKKHHYSGTVSGNDSTDFIEITAKDNAQLSFNLVWSDGYGTHNNLMMKYYDQSQNELASVTQYTTTESNRGTESKYSSYDSLANAGTYYIKVINNSLSEQDFHIYFNRQSSANVTFKNPDQNYTIGQPASADHAFAVGAWTTRNSWQAYNGSDYLSGQTINEIATFSSRGPRIDGIEKPNITAPGSVIISLRDTDIHTTDNFLCIDNDGITNAGDVNYIISQGTSMATPIAAGAAALLLEKYPDATPAMIYEAIQNNANTSGIGAVPNSTWGYGKLDIYASLNDAALPVELATFNVVINNKLKNIELNWQTATEVNNYGFEVERLTQNENEDIQNNKWEKIAFINGHGNSNSPKFYNYFDNTVSSGKFQYRLKQIDFDGKYSYSNVVEVDLGLPTEFSLKQNYPNPFNPSTVIEYTIPSTGMEQSNQVILKVYDILGKEAATLVNKKQPAGNYKIKFNANNLSNGVYFYKLTTGNYTATKKLILMK